MFTLNPRNYQECKTQIDTAYEFLDKSSWKISDLVRQKMNEWVSTYKIDNEFMSMFKSQSDQQHYSAVFELLTFTLLQQSGLFLTKHPGFATNKKPDFEVRGNDFYGYVECTLAGNSFESSLEKNRKDIIEEMIDELEFFPYWINLNFLTTSKQSISRRRLFRFINEVKDYSEGIPNEALLNLEHLFEDNGWELKISVLRKANPNFKRSLGFVSTGAKTINTSKPLLRALNDKKADRYGIIDAPYIICLNTSDLFTKESCFEETFFGQCGDNKINLAYYPQNGFYLAEGKPVNTTVSAVVIFRNFDLFTFDHSSIAVWHNPFAKNKVPANLLPFDEYVYELNGNYLVRTIINKDKDVFQMLGIDKEEYITSKSKSRE